MKLFIYFYYFFYVSKTQFISAGTKGGTHSEWGKETEKGIRFVDTNSAEQNCIDQTRQGETVEENIDGRTNDIGCLCVESSSSIEGISVFTIILQKEEKLRKANTQSDTLIYQKTLQERMYLKNMK